jgi:hypothetical protein
MKIHILVDHVGEFRDRDLVSRDPPRRGAGEIHRHCDGSEGSYEQDEGKQA